MTKEFSTVGVFGKRDSVDYEPLRIIAELLIKSGRQVLLEKKPAEDFFDLIWRLFSRSGMAPQRFRFQWESSSL